jgi:hypothetical protein
MTWVRTDSQVRGATVKVGLELAKVFGVRLTQSDVGDWLTIGDVYDTLRTCIDDGLRRDGMCMDRLLPVSSSIVELLGKISCWTYSPQSACMATPVRGPHRH